MTSCIWCRAAPPRAHRLTCAAQACRDAQDEHSRPAYDCREYARCDECGADAGAPCADEEDAWTRSPCRGRALLVKAPTPPPAKDTRCTCGRPARDGETCGRRICYPALRCCVCRAELQWVQGRSPRAAKPCCGKKKCVSEIRRMRERERPVPPPAPSPPPQKKRGWAESITCPTCEALPWHGCRRANGQPLRGQLHRDRVILSARAA